MAISILNAGPSTLVTEPSDLPYAMVAPGEWTFSDGESRSLGAPRQHDGEWAYYSEDIGWSDSFETEADALYALTISFSYYDPVTATRASLPGQLFDRAINKITVTGAETLTFPEFIGQDKARDFIVNVHATSSGASITWQGRGGEAPPSSGTNPNAPSYVTTSGQLPSIADDSAGDYLFSFTEVAPHVFAVSMKTVSAVS